MPTTAFFQVLVDMKNSANVVPGKFAAKGHDYRGDLLPFFHCTLGFDATGEQLDRIGTWLELEELQRSEWMCLNGTWRFELGGHARDITVPGAWEASQDDWLTDGPAELPPADLERLARNGVGVREDPRGGAESRARVQGVLGLDGGGTRCDQRAHGV